jgi:glutaminyl-peptide cyclotransferase
METMRLRPALALAAGAALAAFAVAAAAPPRTPVYRYKIIHVYPHDRNAFTQGLEYRGGFLFEGTGLNGKSSLRKMDLESGKVLQEIRVDSQYFGEGITLLGERIVELTWQSHRGFVYDRNTFHLIRTFDYLGEGWGLANDGHQIYMSDGTAQIRIWDPTTFQETRRITVHDGRTPIESLNELECVHGEIYSNVWQTDRIARIAPADGRVTGWIDLSGLLTAADRAEGADVLNGIAYDSLGDRLFVTGKLWPKLFEIQLVRKS